MYRGLHGRCVVRTRCPRRSSRRPHMEMVSGLDLHRSQITFRTVDLRTGEVQRGKIHPGARDRFREWLGRVEPGTDAHFALEGTTGWRFVVEEIERRAF